MQGNEVTAWCLNSERFIVPNKIRRGQLREDFEGQAKVFEPYSVNDGAPLRKVVEGCRSLQLL